MWHELLWVKGQSQPAYSAKGFVLKMVRESVVSLIDYVNVNVQWDQFHSYEDKKLKWRSTFPTHWLQMSRKDRIEGLENEMWSTSKHSLKFIETFLPTKFSFSFHTEMDVQEKQKILLNFLKNKTWN